MKPRKRKNNNQLRRCAKINCLRVYERVWEGSFFCQWGTEELNHSFVRVVAFWWFKPSSSSVGGSEKNGVSYNSGRLFLLCVFHHAWTVDGTNPKPHITINPTYTKGDLTNPKPHITINPTYTKERGFKRINKGRRKGRKGENRFSNNPRIQAVVAPPPHAVASVGWHCTPEGDGAGTMSK